MSVRLNIKQFGNRRVVNEERESQQWKIERGKPLPLLMILWTSGSILNDVNAMIDRSCDVTTLPSLGMFSLSVHVCAQSHCELCDECARCIPIGSFTWFYQVLGLTHPILWALR